MTRSMMHHHEHRHHKPLPPVQPPVKKFVVDVKSDITVVAPDGSSFVTSRMIQWEVEAENHGLAAYSYWTGKVIGWKKIN